MKINLPLKVSFALALGVMHLLSAEYHVAVGGNDSATGSNNFPFRTIQHAADAAQPGDVITVHAGTYREEVRPLHGGTSASRRITFQAAPGERVEVKGSEVVTNWMQVQAGVWKAVLPNSLFGAFNPYSDLIHGDWFNGKGRQHHTGAVYLDGNWLEEAAGLEQVLKPAQGEALWYGQVNATNTTIWAQFKAIDPNQSRVEINVRRSVFYPARTGCDYITVRGFVLSQAATPWAPPTAEQIGLIGTHWSKGWIIESNVISYSRCSGVTLGKYGDQWDNTSANSAGGYVLTIQRALTNGWNRETIGHHIVRDNEISHCEQTGICGSLGAIFSTITGNKIHDIHVQRLFTGAEMGGIKLHGAIDCLISQNHIYRAYRGLWLDWMAQGTRVSANLFHDNSAEDIYTEVDHGPFVVDNNLLFSPVNLWDMSEGGAYAQNLFAGRIITQPEWSRSTPFHFPHSTALAGLTNIAGGDHRFFNNIFLGNGTDGADSVKAPPAHQPRGAGFGLWVYDVREVPIIAQGNVYFNGARPWKNETDATVRVADPEVKLVQDGIRFVLKSRLDGLPSLKEALVTTARLGKARVPGAIYENPDGSPLKIDTDFLGAKRDEQRLNAGPFADWPHGILKLP